MEDDLLFPTMKDSDGMHCGPSGGITKREYFAGLCLQGMLADRANHGAFGWMAREAVLAADALIAALAEGKT